MLAPLFSEEQTNICLTKSKGIYITILDRSMTLFVLLSVLSSQAKSLQVEELLILLAVFILIKLSQDLLKSENNKKLQLPNSVKP